MVPSPSAGALPAQGEVAARQPMAKRRGSVAKPLCWDRAVGTPGRNAQASTCQLRAPLLWERNVCYASPPLCPHPASATGLFVATSAQENLRGRKLQTRASITQGNWRSGPAWPFRKVPFNSPLLISPKPGVNFAPPSRHPRNLRACPLASPTFIAHAS